MQADGVANILIKEVEGTLQCEDQAFVRSVASACITYGLESHASGLQLHPVLLARVGEYCKKMAYDGKLSDKLKTLPCQCCFQLIQGPGQAAVLLNLATLFPGTSARLRQVVKVITKHPKA